MKTSGFPFVDIMNYLGPGTSYEKWVEAHCGAGLKSCHKLGYPGLPDYPALYSRLKGSYPLTLAEWQDCKKKSSKKKGWKLSQTDYVITTTAMWPLDWKPWERCARFTRRKTSTS